MAMAFTGSASPWAVMCKAASSAYYWSFGLWSDAKVMGKNFMIIRSCYWTAKRRLKDQDKCT